MEKRKVFVFGNPLVKEDSLALKVAERLKGKLGEIEFVAVQGLDGVESEKDLLILDVAKGIERAELVEDLEKLETSQPVSLHDFDLAMELKLLKKAGRIGKVKVIAIPERMAVEEAVAQARKRMQRI